MINLEPSHQGLLLTGSFSEYPLPMLLEILQHKHETGLLEISSAEQSGYIYLKNGDVKRCDFGGVGGADTIELVKSLTDASFHFRQLPSTDYARVVWQTNFGPLEASEKADIRAQFHMVVPGLLTYFKSKLLYVRTHASAHPLLRTRPGFEQKSVNAVAEFTDRIPSSAQSEQVNSPNRVSVHKKPSTKPQLTTSPLQTRPEINQPFPEIRRSIGLIERSQQHKTKVVSYGARQLAGARETIQSLTASAAGTVTTTQNSLTRTWISVSGMSERYARRALEVLTVQGSLALASLCKKIVDVNHAASTSKDRIISSLRVNLDQTFQLIRRGTSRTAAYVMIHSRHAFASLPQKVSTAQIAAGTSKDRIISSLRMNLGQTFQLIRRGTSRTAAYVMIHSRHAFASLQQKVSAAQIAAGIGKDRITSNLRVNLQRTFSSIRGRMNRLQPVAEGTTSQITNSSSDVTATNVHSRTPTVSYPSFEAQHLTSYSRTPPTATTNSRHVSLRTLGEDNLSFGIIVVVLVSAASLTTFALFRSAVPANFPPTPDSVVAPVKPNTRATSKQQRVRQKMRTNQESGLSKRGMKSKNDNLPSEQ